MPAPTAAPTAAQTATDPSELAARLRLVITRLARRLRREGAAGISPTQTAILATVEREGPLTLGTLAVREQVTPPTVTAAVSRLEEQGLVTRAVDPSDRRVARVDVTHEGRRLLRRARARKDEALARSLRAVSDEDRVALARVTDLLERILDDGASAR